MIPGIVSFPLFASAPAMSAVANPSAVSKVQGGYGSTKTLTTPTTTVSVTGGTAPYTHSWAGGVAATAPTSATSAFRATLSPGDIVTETMTDTVTDANGVTAEASCGVYLQNVDYTQ
jgi:hypothetical protein